MSQSESDRDKLERLARENLAKRNVAEKQREDAAAAARQQQLIQNEIDIRLTKELIDLLKPIFEGFKLPETGHKLSVSASSSVSRMFSSIAMDSLPNVHVSMLHNGQSVALFMIQCRKAKYWLSEIFESQREMPSVDSTKEFILTKIAELGRKEVIEILNAAGFSDR